MSFFRRQRGEKGWRLMEVQWDDACSRCSWRTSGEACQEVPPRIASVGYLLRDDDEVVVLAGSRSSSGKVSDCLTVPRGCVVSMREVEA